MLKLEIDFEFGILWITILISIITLFLILFDVQYFVRTFFVILWGRYVEGQKHPEDVTTIYGICTFSDLDIVFRHMNNARYVRELDFARYHFYDRTGIYSAVGRKGGTILQSASLIKYRKTIPLFTTYKITTKMVGWDDKNIYIEQQFVTLNDGFVRAISHSKQVVVGYNVAEGMPEILQKNKDYKLTPLPEIKYFNAVLEESSIRLRKKDDNKEEKKEDKKDD